MKGIARWSTVLVLLIGMGAGIPASQPRKRRPQHLGTTSSSTGTSKHPWFPTTCSPSTRARPLATGPWGAGRSIWSAASGRRLSERSRWISRAASRVHLPGPSNGGGRTYTLTFQMAGNYAGPPTVKSMQVFWNDVSLGILTFDTTGRGPANMGWTLRTVPSLVRPAPPRA